MMNSYFYLRRITNPQMLLVCAFACVTAIVGCAPDRPADEEIGQREIAYGDDPVENGRISYQTYCASCHGESARGDGPVAEYLTIPPPDLTLLKTAHDGEFPAEYVYSSIDGRERVRAHGTREMPVWGNILLERDEGFVSPEEVDLRIREMVEYIRTLQRNEGAQPDQ